jgi:predicted metal-dependent phosphoesterase TrpH
MSGDGQNVLLKFDLHVHTNASHDGASSALEMAEAAKARGLDGIAITDHDVIMDSLVASSLSERTGMIIIPGVEVTTAEGHFVILMPKRVAPRGIGFMNAARAALADGSVPFIPHPTDPLSHGVGEAVVRGSIALRLPIEVLNASTVTKYNRTAWELADNLSLPKLASSDAHITKAVGDAYTTIDASDRSLEASLEAIRAGKTSPNGGRTPTTTTLEAFSRSFLRRVGIRKNV